MLSSNCVSVWMTVGVGVEGGRRRECTTIVARARDAGSMKWSTNNTAATVSFSCLLFRVFGMFKGFLGRFQKFWRLSLCLFETTPASRYTNGSVRRSAVKRYDCTILIQVSFTTRHIVYTHFSLKMHLFQLNFDVSLCLLQYLN